METLIEPALEFIKVIRQLNPFLWALILLGVSFLLGYILRAAFYAWLRRYNQRHDWKVGKLFVHHLGNRARLFFPLLVFWMAQGVIRLPNPYDDFLQKITQALLIIAFGWIMLKSINVLEDIAYYYYEEERGDRWRERRVRTQLQFIQRILGVVIFILVFGSVLLTFSEVREVGATLLTSAGVAGIIIGIAAQKSPANFLAGLQIAITQPIKIDDAVIVEGEWGNIEEITLTYVVVRIWDKRRLILPITYFIEKPFQNWTRTSSELVGAILLYVDYRVPLDRLREQLTKILAEEQLWDEQTNVIQVVDTTEKALVIRVLVSSTDASNTWALRCQVREKLVQYLQQHHPESLPQIRMNWIDKSSGNQDLQSLPAI